MIESPSTLKTPRNDASAKGLKKILDQLEKRALIEENTKLKSRAEIQERLRRLEEQNSYLLSLARYAQEYFNDASSEIQAESKNLLKDDQDSCNKVEEPRIDQVHKHSKFKMQGFLSKNKGSIDNK